MRAAVRVLLAILLALSGAGVARAGYDESQEWFNALPLDQRTEIQGDLILLGYYNFLVDGAFGQGTFSSLTSYQRSLSRAVTGVLSEGDLTRLKTDAEEVSTRLGLNKIDDNAGGISIYLPAALLTVSRNLETGTEYKTEDGGITLITARRPVADQSFRDLYDTLAAEAPRRIVSYSNFNDERFVVTGTDAGRRFYLMYRNADSESVGYVVSWTQSYHRDATIISTYLASYAEPLLLAPATQEEQTISNAVALRQFGSFTLPDTQPFAIRLNDEIGNSTARDFEKALAARPDATVLILNSPGGYVDTALVIANEVHRRGMITIVPRGSGCYSACAYIYFAGQRRQVDGELGVHQIYTEVADLVFAQTTLSDILDALDAYGVEQAIISHMLRTPPEDMYVFTKTEILNWDINQGDPIDLASIGPEIPVAVPIEDNPPANTGEGAAAFVHLAQFSNREEAERSLEAAKNRWGSVLEDAVPEIQPVTKAGKQSFRIRVPVRSVESANAMCAAIKSGGGGCYVTQAG
jgi:hypothetical protein